MQVVAEEGMFKLGNWPLAGGGVLQEAKLGYRIWGKANKKRNNFIVLPSYYTGTHDSYAPLIGPGRALDPARFCIVAVDLFGNGISSSPSNSEPCQCQANFPKVGIYDNVYAQHRFLSEALDMRSVALVAGWSMGGIQAYHWAAVFPDTVRRILPWCAAARCSQHNWVFLEGVKAALTADGAWFEGGYKLPPETGLRAFARVYCGWAHSQAFFNEHGYRKLGFETADDLLKAWEEEHLKWDANDLLAKIQSWQMADIAAHPVFEGDFEAALRAIRARAILLPCARDLYFTPEDNAREAMLMPDAELRVVNSIYGHAAGGPGRDAQFMQALETALEDLLVDYWQEE